MEKPSDTAGPQASLAEREASEEPAKVRFVLDGRVVTLPRVAPTRTLLEVLREDLGRTGTKEGCAEGDCGACTVMVGELLPDGSGVRYRTRNACINFAATLDGRELLTVESLSREGEPPHPVQQAMVECHGSQCGFCTPGFVMSLLALFKRAERPTRSDIDDALAGNLCRCTGYRPIVAAARAMYELARAESDTAPWLRRPFCASAPPSPMLATLQGLRRTQTLELATPEGTFWAPATLKSALELLARHPEACIVAGGTDVGLWVTKQGKVPSELLFLGNIAELEAIEVREQELVIGATAALSDAFPLLVADYPGLSELCARFASPPIRDAATLGGNLQNASPIGDSAPVLLALDARLVLCSERGSRELPLHEFFLAYQRTARAPDELLCQVCVPRPQADEHVFAYKVSKRFDQDISALCGAFRARLLGGLLHEVRVAFGGMAATPKRAQHVERALEGKGLDDPTLNAAMAALTRDFRPIDDLRATAAYRMQVAQNLLRRFFLSCTGAPEATSLYRYAR